MLWQARWKYFGIIGIVLGLLSIATVKTPDIIIGPEAKAVAFKNINGELEIASSRSGRFIKNVWKNKYKVSATKTKLENHDEVTITGNKVIYDNKIYDLSKDVGMSIYFKDNKVITIRDDIGKRYWN